MPSWGGHDMALRPENGLSLCSGGGGLDMGLMLAEPGLHTRAFVEWEEHPRAAIIAAQRAGYFAPAPIWDDLTTFDARPLAGAIDTLLAGYPCQPFSQAGQRKGEADERHLWPHVARVARELGDSLEWIFLENVAGHVSLGLEAVLRELWEMGFTPAAGLFSAEEVGAPHERLRLFVVAHRSSERRQQVAGSAYGDEAAHEGRAKEHYHQPSGSGSAMAHPHGGNASAERQQRGGKQRLHATGGRTGAVDVGDTGHTEWRSIDAGRHDANRNNTRRAETDCRSGKPSQDVGHATSVCREIHEGQGPEGAGTSDHRRSGRAMDNAASPRCEGARVRADERSDGHECRKPIPGDGRTELAHSGGARPQGQFSGQLDAQGRQEQAGHAGLRGGAGLFPPGPADADGWADTIRVSPGSAPALSRQDAKTAALRFAAVLSPETTRPIQPGALGLAGRDFLRTLGSEAAQMVGDAAAFTDFCRSVDGLAARSRALRLLGNGVVPLVAGYAWRTLSAAHGLGCVDLEAPGRRCRVGPARPVRGGVT